MTREDQNDPIPYHEFTEDQQAAFFRSHQKVQLLFDEIEAVLKDAGVQLARVHSFLGGVAVEQSTEHAIQSAAEDDRQPSRTTFQAKVMAAYDAACDKLGIESCGAETEFVPAPIPTGVEMIRDRAHMQNGQGDWKPVSTFKPQDLLQDETVRRIVGFAIALSDQVKRFKAHTFEDIGSFEALLAQEYDAAVGGAKGNKSLLTVDGRYKVVVQISDRLDFGPELQVAKQLFDECLDDWSEGARDELRGFISQAFDTDRSGTINRSQMFMLLRYETDDPKFHRAQDAIKDAIRVIGTTKYVRCYRREDQSANWEPITIDLAKA